MCQRRQWFDHQGFLQLSLGFERKEEESLNPKGVATEVWDTKLQTTLSFYSSGTDSVEFCMTLTLSGVSKTKVTSERYQCDPPVHENQ